MLPDEPKLYPQFAFRPGIVTDPIWWFDVLKELEVEQEVKSRLLATRFETLAAVHGAIAEGATKAAGLLARGAAE
jgi:hypothetical protein